MVVWGFVFLWCNGHCFCFLIQPAVLTEQKKSSNKYSQSWEAKSLSVTRLPHMDLGLTGLSFSPAGVLLHVMGDALGSVVVVITAIIFYVLPLKREDPCNWQCYIDPSLTVIMVIIILSSAFPLIKETAAILLQMVPKGVNMEELSKSCHSDLKPLPTECSSGQSATLFQSSILKHFKSPSSWNILLCFVDDYSY